MSSSSQRVVQLQRLTSLGAFLGVAAGLFLLGGLSGAVFGVAALGVWLFAPPVFAFVLAQAGVAAVATTPYPALLVGVEATLFIGVLSDSRVPVTYLSRLAAGGSVAAIAGGVWLLASQSIWMLVIGTLAVVACLLYGVHRYELLLTGQLEDE